MRSVVKLALGLALACFPSVAAADIYMTKDANGDITISQRPKPGSTTTKVIKEHEPSRFGGLAVPPSDHDIGRYTRYDETIREAATLYQIPEQLVRAIIKCESDYDPRAVSGAGAHGLMQLMPDTAERMQVRDIDDPRENIFGGTRLLRILANEFNGDLELTIAAYNAGDGAVMRFGGIPPFAETRDYVVNVTRFYRRYRAQPDPTEASLSHD